MNRLYSSPLKSTTLLVAMTLLGWCLGIAQAAVISNVQATKHNLSAAIDGSGVVPLRGVKAASESQVCVFCHTPHNANQSVSSPLWNRGFSSATYTPYTSDSMDAITTQPTGDSKLCLSCHDGTIAIGTVGVLNGVGPVTIPMSGTGAGGVIPNGLGASTGFTRNIGIALGNDHPISFAYNPALAAADGELRNPPVIVSGSTVVGNQIAGVHPKPIFPLQSDQMQCSTCHDPHLADTVVTNSPLKFLRGNRLQQIQPTPGLFDSTNDIMCLACHDKAAGTWAFSAHANELVANETYLDSAANLREFARGTKVWQASCLNCHDTHSVEGSRRLLREGTNALNAPGIPKSGGSAAGEETCYQCHNLSSASVLDPIAPPNITPDIKSDFSLTYRMPISLQPEVHSIGGNFNDTSRGGPRCNTPGDQCGKDFVESQFLLGKASAGIGGGLINRHAECTDCHNPHRATKNRLFNANAIAPDAAGTHKHNIVLGDTSPHNNLASGSLRGTFGVEPIYLSAEFGSTPTNFDVKRGDIGTAINTAITSTYVTREYQVCLKCHSNYAFDNTTPPPLPIASLTGGTQERTNGMLYYSDVAMEFQAPVTHQQPETIIGTPDSGASSAYSAFNHRSWHPVIDKTGRTSLTRPGVDANLWRAPWNGSNVDGGIAIVANAVGTQTMQCGDCHGSTTNMLDGVVPANGDINGVWGPHGSNDNFILKGAWNTDAPSNHNVGSNNLCFRCHEENQYAKPIAASGVGAIGTLSSGFSGFSFPNLHQSHAYLTTQGGTINAPSWPVSANGTYRCTMCHTGTAHGWKNKAFLTNLNDLGPEILAIGGEIPPSIVPASGVPASGVPTTTLLAGASVPKGTAAPIGTSVLTGGYSNGPYYRGSMLSIAATGFKAPGTWVKTDCGTSGCHLP